MLELTAEELAERAVFRATPADRAIDAQRLLRSILQTSADATARLRTHLASGTLRAWDAATQWNALRRQHLHAEQALVSWAAAVADDPSLGAIPATRMGTVEALAAAVKMAMQDLFGYDPVTGVYTRIVAREIEVPHVGSLVASTVLVADAGIDPVEAAKVSTALAALDALHDELVRRPE